MISTRAPGAARVYAKLLWRSPDALPDELPILEGLVGDADYETRCALEAAEVAGGRVLTGTIRAMTSEALGEGVGGFLRSISVYAARTDAVLETSVLRTAEPIVIPADVVGWVARRLAAAGVPVLFGRAWTPLTPGACCGVGVRGMEGWIGPLLQDLRGGG